jgi:hypothetical protein
MRPSDPADQTKHFTTVSLGEARRCRNMGNPMRNPKKKGIEWVCGEKSNNLISSGCNSVHTFCIYDIHMYVYIYMIYILLNINIYIYIFNGEINGTYWVTQSEMQ